MTKQSTIVGASVIMGIALLIPLLFTTVAPSCDGYFHIARMVVLQDPAAPFVRDWHALDWHLIPNLAMDLIVPALSKTFPTLVSVNIFIALTLELLFFGTIALHWAIYRQLSWFPLISGLIIYNQIFFIGFLNYLFSVGLALIIGALWFYLRDRSTISSSLIAAFGAVAIYFSHLFGLVVFGLLLASGEFALARRDRRFLHHAIVCILPFSLPVILILTSTTAHVGSATSIEYWPIAKILGLLTPFLTLNPPVDLLVFLIVAMVAVVGVVGRCLQVADQLRLALLALPVLLVVLPTQFMGGLYADLRFPIAASFVAIAACRVTDDRRLLNRAMALVVGGVFLVRIAALTVDFSVAGRELTDIRIAFQHLKPGAVVFSGDLQRKSFFVEALTTPRSWNNLLNRRDTLPLTHLTTLALVDQAVFVPEAALISGQQPVKIRSDFEELKRLQADAAGHWYSYHDAHPLKDAEAVTNWVQEIKQTLTTPYRFSAVYIALVDPNHAAVLPADAEEAYSGHGYRIWNVSKLVYAAQSSKFVE